MKNDNAHSIRMVESLRNNINDEVANDLEDKYPLWL
jgi:hypothetical protein